MKLWRINAESGYPTRLTFDKYNGWLPGVSPGQKWIVFIILVILSCRGQTEVRTNQKIGGSCEDCEATLDYKIMQIKPNPVDTLPGFEETASKIRISGTVLKPDRKTPAKNVILYVYHTNTEGIYEPGPTPVGWEKRHGKFRGWLKTGPDGKFVFYTFRPAPYPDGREPEHIHIYIKEPDKNPYYIDNYTFDDDPILTREKRKSMDKRGGSGIIKLENKNGILTAERDIILGLNIPDYK